MKALVGIIMGSRSDWETLSVAAEMLTELGVPHEVKVVSAHRTPDLLFEYAASAESRGLSAIIAGAGTRVFAASDIVLYASDFTRIQGDWSTAASSGAAGGQMLASVDAGWASTASPLAGPSNYVEATFTAPSFTKYHVWLRLRAANDSKYNDSVFV